MDKPVEDLVSEYLELAIAIEEAEGRQADIKETLQNTLGLQPERDGDHGQTFEFTTGKVTWVKASTRERIDRAKLVQQGVTQEVIEKATVVSSVSPSLRVSRLVK